MGDLEQQRQILREQVEHEEQELREAVEELKDAVAKPFRWLERFAENPVPWVLSGALIGLWLGSMGSNDGHDT